MAKVITSPLFFVLFVGLTNCYAQQVQDDLADLELEGLVTVHIQSAPQKEPLRIKLSILHSFPMGDRDVANDSITLDRKEITISIPCRYRGNLDLSIADSTYQLLGAPGDTLFLSVLRWSNISGRPLVSFEGKNKAIHQYYRAKNLLFKDVMQVCMDEGINADNLVPFQKLMDSTYNRIYEFWTGYQKTHPLPDWFKIYETNALNYSDAWLRVYMVWYQTDYQKKKQHIPESYYEFQKRIKIKNEAAIYQEGYLMFLREHLFWQIRNSGQHLPSIDLIDYARSELGENLGSFVGIREISKSADNPNWADIRTARQFPARFQYLINYIQKRSESNIKLLKPGDKAPGFALVDENDSLVTLKQFKGQVVYLSFWFTTCGPCIQEIPFENKLAAQFEDRPFKIISICTGTPGAQEDQQVIKWKAASKRYDLKTINLYSNPSWTKTLRQNYIVSAYPHYVLIDPDGNIIENFAERPSQNIAAKIEKALAGVKNTEK